MAKKSNSGSKTSVRRIKATDDSPKKTTIKKTTSHKETSKKTSATKTTKGVKKVGYFVGAWQELKQVRWPTRSATWSMTIAVLAFTAFFVTLVLVLDAGFNWLFNQILK